MKTLQFNLPIIFTKDILKKEYEVAFLELLKFSMSEVSTENMIFIAAVDSYQKKPTKDLFNYINNNFIIATADDQVNISSTVLKSIKEPSNFIDVKNSDNVYYLKMISAKYASEAMHETTKIYSTHGNSRNRSDAFSSGGTPEFSIFDKAKLEIIKLIERDTYPRFIKDPLITKTHFFNKSPTYHTTNQRVCSESEFKKIEDFRENMRTLKASVHMAFYLKRDEFKNVTPISSDNTW